MLSLILRGLSRQDLCRLLKSGIRRYGIHGPSTAICRALLVCENGSVEIHVNFEELGDRTEYQRLELEIARKTADYTITRTDSAWKHISQVSVLINDNLDEPTAKPSEMGLLLENTTGQMLLFVAGSMPEYLEIYEDTQQIEALVRGLALRKSSLCDGKPGSAHNKF